MVEPRQTIACECFSLHISTAQTARGRYSIIFGDEFVFSAKAQNGKAALIVEHVPISIPAKLGATSLYGEASHFQDPQTTTKTRTPQETIGSAKQSVFFT